MRGLLDWEDPPPARWPGPHSGNNNADFNCRRRSQSRGAQRQRRLFQPNLPVKSPPPHVTSSTVAQASLEPNISPYHLASLVDKRLDTEGSHIQVHQASCQSRPPLLFCVHNMDCAPESETEGEQEEGWYHPAKKQQEAPQEARAVLSRPWSLIPRAGAKRRKKCHARCCQLEGLCVEEAGGQLEGCRKTRAM